MNSRLCGREVQSVQYVTSCVLILRVPTQCSLLPVSVRVYFILCDSFIWTSPNRHQTKMKLESDRFGIEYDDDILHLWNHVKHFHKWIHIIHLCSGIDINTHHPVQCGWVSAVACNAVIPTGHFGGGYTLK